MKRLILSEIPSDYNSQNDVVISAASFLGNEDKLDREDQVFFETYNLKNKKEAAEEATAIAYEFLPFITKKLNEKYNLNKNEQFWKTITFPWLLSISHIFLDRYYRVTYFVDKYSKEDFEVEIAQREDHVSFLGSDDVLTFFQNHAVNHWVYSLFIEKIAPIHWLKKIKKVKISQYAYTEVKSQTFERRLAELTKRILRVSYVYGFSGLESILFTLFLWVNPKKVSSSEPVKTHFIKPIAIPRFFQEVEFQNILLEFLPKEFDQVPILIKKPMGLWKGKVRILGPVFYSDIYFKVLAARAIEKGEIVFSSQHGGGYGRFELVNYVRELETQFNGFISWGWKEHDSFSGKVIPLPSPYLSKLEDIHSQKTNDIILVGTKCNPYADRIEFSFEPSHMLEYRYLKRRFIEALSNEIKTDFYYRPYPKSHFYFEDFSYQQKHFPPLQQLTGNFHSKMKECRLLVLDHAQTTLNLAMAANVPCICLLTEKDWQVSEYAQKSVDSLKSVGIVYTDPVALAQFINKEDIICWWNSDSVQKARKEWVYEHARVSRSWKKEWFKMLWNHPGKHANF